MRCKDCEREIYKAYWKSSRFVCLDCFGMDVLPNKIGFYHAKAGNKHAPWLTKAGDEVITHRRQLPTGDVIDLRTGRESPQLTSD